MASNHPDEGLSASEGGTSRGDLPHHTGGAGHPAHTEARAELRDRETYYAELRFAVHCQNRSVPAPRSAHADPEDTGTEESWDEMIARFGDTWT